MPIRLISLTRTQVKQVIQLAASKAEKVTLENITKPDGLSIDGTSGLELQQLVTVIDRLPLLAKNELMTLMWLGMGTIDNDQGSWAGLLQAAHEEQFNDLPERLALMPHLHEYLHRGLEKFGTTRKPHSANVDVSSRRAS